MSVKEAQSLFSEGTKLASKTLFRWKPDHDGAAEKFEKAAVIYRNNKLYDDAVTAYKLASDSHYKANNFYFSGKCLENAALALRDAKKSSLEMAKFYKRAGDIYLEDGKPDRAMEAFTKGAKGIEKEFKDPVPAEACNYIINLYKAALDGLDDKYHLMGETFRSLNSFLMRNNLVDEVIQNLQTQITAYQKLKQPHNVYKVYLTIIVVHLYNDDWAAADEANSSFLEKTPEWGQTEEYYAGESLMDAFKRRDQEAVKKALENQRFKYLEGDFARCARKLVLDGNSNPKLVGDLGAQLARKEKQQKRIAQVANEKSKHIDQKKAALFDTGAEEEDENEEEENYEEDDEPVVGPSAKSDKDLLDPYNFT